jgi:hypothetical protein
MPAAENFNKFWNLARKIEGLSQITETLVFLEPHRAFRFLLSLGERIEVRAVRSCDKLLRREPGHQFVLNPFL